MLEMGDQAAQVSYSIPHQYIYILNRARSLRSQIYLARVNRRALARTRQISWVNQPPDIFIIKIKMSSP
jgi:hypothetical protein